MEEQKRGVQKGTRKLVWGDGYPHYLDYGDGFSGFMCQNLPNDINTYILLYVNLPQSP